MGSAATYLRSVKHTLVERSPRTLRVAGETVTVRVRESTRAKTARIIVGPRRPLEVIVPEGTSDRDVDSLLREKRAWVERKLRVAAEIAARRPQLGLSQRGVVWLEGAPIAVDVEGGVRSLARINNGRLLVTGEEPVDAIQRWYRRAARARFEEEAACSAARLGLSFDSIGVRDPKTRWGSCSRRGHLSFSWRLVMAPADVLEYVVVHELCHLREANHSRAFWRLLDAVRPGWQAQARWLRENGQELHDYDLTTVLPV